MSDPVKYEFPDKLAGLFGGKRYFIAHGGRGGAKSWNFARAALLLAAEKPTRVLCTREVQKSIKDSVHQLLCDQIALLGLGGFYKVTRDEITGQNGSRFLFAGLSDQTSDSLKSYEGIDVCWVEEAHKVTRRSWDILIPTIRKPSSRIWISLNPELDTDETYVRFVASPPEDAEVVRINWRDNPWFPEVLDKERQEFLRQVDLGTRTRDEYENIWEGRCRSAVEGAIYAREIAQAIEEKRIRPCPYDPMLKVHTVWDLGWNDQMSIICVQRGPELRVIDYIEDSHRTLADYVADLATRKWAWGLDFLPHDGRAKDYKSGKSAEEILKGLGREPRIVENLDVESGIKAARMVFPRVYFDEARATRLVHCLKRYRRAISSSTGEAGAPLHDEYSHAADAFRYMAIASEQMTNTPAFDATKFYEGFRNAASF